MAPQIVTTPIAIRNILFTTDFSAASVRAFPHALALARQHGATVHIAHVTLPLTEYMDPGAESFEYARWIETRATVRQKMQEFAPPEALEGVKYQTELREGALWECVSSLIEENKIDLVILGTKGAGGLTRLMLGSQAEQIFREASCPVMTIGPHIRPDSRGEFKQVLFALDFTDTSLHAYPYALAFATEGDGRLIVLHVVLPAHVEFGGRGMPEYIKHMRALALKEVSKVTDYSGPVRPEVVVDCGEPSNVILHHARELAADLIVLGIHHRTRLGTHLPWTIAHEVVSDAPCPVLTIRS